MDKKIQNNKIIIDNILEQEESKRINDVFYGEQFPWYFKNYVVAEDQIEKDSSAYQYQFTHHMLREDGNIVTEQFNWQLLFPIFNRIYPNTFVRIKANMIPRADKIVTHGFHVDCTVPFSMTAIYYVNTNDGCTEFKDGDKIESVQNRIVIFPSNMYHSGTTCTNSNSRVAININFIPRYTPDTMYKEILQDEEWKAIQKWFVEVE